jgi:hypothetical protein
MLLYDIPGNRYVAVPDSFLHQKGRGKFQTAPEGPERLIACLLLRFMTLLTLLMAPMAPMAPNSDGSGTVPHATVRYDTVRYGTVRYGTVPHARGVPERTKSGAVLCRTESARIGTVSIANDMLGGGNGLGSTS